MGVESSVDRDSESKTAGDPDSPRPFESIPKIDGYPILGSTIRLFADPREFLQDCAEIGDIVRFSGFYPGVVITHPALIEQVLVTDNEKYLKGKLMQDTVGTLGREQMELMNGKGDPQWERHRMIAQKGFSPAHIRETVDTIVASTQRVLNEMEGGGDPPHTVEIYDKMSEIALSVMTKTVFGTNDDDLRERIGTASANLTSRLSSPSVYLPDWAPTPRTLRFRRGKKQIHTVIDELIEREQTDERKFTKGPQLLSRFFEAWEEGEITETELRHELTGISIAGHDTTAISLTSTLHFLATHSDKQARLQDELEETLDGSTPSFTDLQELDYLDNVITESLRLMPATSHIFRETGEDLQLGEYHVPEGQTIMIPIWTIQRDDRFYDDPETFRPERWESGLKDEIPEYAYLPFSGGPQHCLGHRLAMAEMKTVLATILQEWTFEPHYEQLPEMEVRIAMVPTAPIEMKITPQ